VPLPRSFDPAELQHGDNEMSKPTIGSRSIRRSLLAAGLVAGAMFTLLGPASAGECPADKRGTDLTKMDTTPAKGVTDTVLAAIKLADEPAKIADRELRLRKLVIQPGGVVPWHSHGDRPAIIYIIEGEIVEYASTCAVPIVHKAGDVARESHTTAHWWKNTGDKTVVLLSADLLHDRSDKNM
jgi:quercetin dioxygenase-like cupin family protein